jgi:cephalosporin-C deacetylase-like acetyl esterase
VTDPEVIAMLKGKPAPAVRTARTASARDEEITFHTAHGFALAGRLLLPASLGPHPVVVFAHGWGSGKDSPRNVAVAEALRDRGVATFLFDFTGHGESEGTPEDATPEQEVHDLAAALDALQKLDDVDARRIGVTGASSGAAVAVLTAARDARIRLLALRSPNLSGAEAAVPAVRVPTLLVVGEHDAPTRAAIGPLLGRFGGPCALETIPGGDRLFQDPAALARATAATGAWFRDHFT